MTKTNLDFTKEEAAKLPAHQEAVMRALLENKGYEQIAVELGVAVGTVKSRVNRARLAIKRDRGPAGETAADTSTRPRSQTSAPHVSESSQPDADK